MTKAEQKRYDAMESALKVIHTWASHYFEKYYDYNHFGHRENLHNIYQKCLEALGKKK